MNKVILIGNLGKDVEVTRLDSGVNISKFSLATNESYKDKSGEWKDVTEWHNVVAFRELREDIYVKGTMVVVEGKIKTRKYEDKEGNTRYVTEIVANSVKPLRGSGDGLKALSAASYDDGLPDDLPF